MTTNATLIYANGTERAARVPMNSDRVIVFDLVQRFDSEAQQLKIGMVGLLFERVHSSRATFRQVIPVAEPDR